MVNSSNLKLDTFQRRLTTLSNSDTKSLKSNKANYVKILTSSKTKQSPKTLKSRFDTLSNKQKLALGALVLGLTGASIYGVHRGIKHLKIKNTKSKLKKEFNM